MERARAAAARLRTPFKMIINAALRAGLEQVEQPAKQRRYMLIFSSLLFVRA
jgi:hypothetical protein